MPRIGSITPRSRHCAPTPLEMHCKVQGLCCCMPHSNGYSNLATLSQGRRTAADRADGTLSRSHMEEFKHKKQPLLSTTANACSGRNRLHRMGIKTGEVLLRSSQQQGAARRSALCALARASGLFRSHADKEPRRFDRKDPSRFQVLTLSPSSVRDICL